jgi:hypothetical protein
MDARDGLSGSCLCGAVRWRIDGAPTPFAHCHCSVCRKAHGTSFATYMTAPGSSLEWLSGDEQVATYESSPRFVRRFCRTCGSVLPGVAPDGHVFAPPGSTEGDPGVRAKIHIFVASKAPWFDITDDLRRFDAFPKRDGPPGVTAATRRFVGDGLGGSCLCGTVAFEVRTPITAAHNCHCSRCRRARSAAHATNGFTSADGLRWIRGEDSLVTYKLPDARFFTQVFCAGCGATMPRVDRERGIAVIPYGSLDRDPGLAPQDHIYVGSKAGWFVITDDLPQYAERPPA